MVQKLNNDRKSKIQIIEDLGNYHYLDLAYFSRSMNNGDRGLLVGRIPHENER